MHLCDDVWYHILSYTTLLPRYAYISTSFKEISNLIYGEFLNRIKQKYGDNPIPNRTLNILAFNQEWEEFLVICHIGDLRSRIDIQYASRVCILFYKLPILKVVNPKNLFCMWQYKHSNRYKETRRMLFHYKNGDLEFIHNDMAAYICKMRHIPVKFGGFEWNRVYLPQYHRDRPTTFDEMSLKHCQPHYNQLQALAYDPYSWCLQCAGAYPRQFLDLEAKCDIATPEINKMRSVVKRVMWS